MRFALLCVIVPAIAIAGLFSAEIGLLGYVWFALLRPDILSWSEGRLPFSQALAACTLFGVMPRFYQCLMLLRNPFAIGLLLFQFPVGVSVINALNPEASQFFYWNYVRNTLVLLLIPVLITDVTRFRWLVIVMGASMGVLGIKYGLIGLLTGGERMTYGYGGFLSDNNCLALGLVMAVPLLWYGAKAVRSRLGQGGLILMVAACFAAIVVSHSRGGALASAVIMLWIVWTSKRRMAVLMVLALLVAPMAYVAWDSYSERLSTIATEHETDKNMSRLGLAATALRVWKDYPWFGVGFGSFGYRQIVGAYDADVAGRVCHNNYAQLLADCGTLAFLIYAALLFGSIWWLGKAATREKERASGLDFYPRAIQVSLIGFAVGSFTLSRTDFDFAYMLMMAAASWYEVAENVQPEDVIETEKDEEEQELEQAAQMA